MNHASKIRAIIEDELLFIVDEDMGLDEVIGDQQDVWGICGGGIFGGIDGRRRGNFVEDSEMISEKILQSVNIKYILELTGNFWYFNHVVWESGMCHIDTDVQQRVIYTIISEGINDECSSYFVQ